MKAQNWLYVSCLIGAFAVYGCGDDATSGGYYGSICGNGVVEDGEACDDGNSVNGDGCSADCKAIEPGYVCYEGKPCEQVSGVCGNGKVDDGEACDDGNQVSGDGCSADCKKVESGCKCPERGGACTCSSESICGNGVVEGDEMCDDGNTDDGDGCNADCMGIENGWECPPEGGKCYPKNGYCGDGIVNRIGEECDPGPDGLIGCTDDCKIRTGYDCETDSEGRSNCWEMGCGNGKVEPKNGEECDNGMGNNVEVGSYGFDDNGNPKCDNTCHFVAYCGDGTQNGDEECDNGSDNLDNAYQKDQSNGCTKQCKKAGWCGDGKWNGDEKCDPKDPKSNNGCTDECTPKEGYVCSTLDGSCVLKSELPEPECGNQYIDLALDEECDQEGNGCTDCKADKGYKCFASPKPCSECSAGAGNQCKELNCGDGILDPDGYEQCDLGNDNNGKGEGCSKTCTIEPGYACKTVQKDGKQTSVCNTVCGDGIRTPDEECDAGVNNGKGKGCSAACRIEDYAICTSNEIGKTSKCKAGKCGDGEIGKGEVCDDVNSVGGDGCSADCKAVEAYFKCPKTGGKCSLTECGDRKLNDNNADYVGEECDLGEGKNGEGKGCTDFCRLEPGYECNGTNCTSVRKQTLCGNGTLEGHEECDDGNKLGGDGCSPDCRIETGFECFNNDATSASVCRPTCGDGIWNITSTKTPGIKAQSVKDLIEECDLGEFNGRNKGCTIDCKLQEGYDLELPKVDYPDTIELPVTFRDFKGIDVTADNDKSTGTNKNIGRADANWITKIKTKYEYFGWNDCERVMDGGSNSSGKAVPLQKASADQGHPDFENMTGNLCTGILGSIGKGILGRDGKPVLTRDAMTSECADYERKIVNGTEVDSPGRKNKMVKNHIYCQASFDTWYRDDAKMNLNKPGKLLLAKVPGKTDTYVFDSDNPPAAAKVVSGIYTYSDINTKLRTTNSAGTVLTKSYFAPLYDFGLNEGIVSESSYLKDENANGSFTTEIHTTIQYRGNVATLEFSGDDDVWVYLNNRLFVDVGGMHSKITRSNSIKVETCQNGQKCDKTFGLYDGGIYDLKLFHAERARSGSNFKLTLTGFVPTAKNVPSDFKSECGDGIVAVGREECDYGDTNKNAALYTLMSCDPKTCKKVGKDEKPLKTCGNGIVEPGEMCDTGFLCKEAKYEKICEQYGLKFVEDNNCSNECTIVGSICGNGIKESGEDCDLGKKNAKDGECTPDCKLPRCGDGYVNSAKGEECDMGDVENAKGIVCTEKCKFPYCGDGIVSEYNGEVCDDGINDGSYGHCGIGCTSWGPRCGDGIVDAGKEECDNGAANKDGKYGGCTTSCTWGPRCGDGIVQEGDNEECDEGANNGKPGSGCTVACRMIVN